MNAQTLSRTAHPDTLHLLCRAAVLRTGRFPSMLSLIKCHRQFYRNMLMSIILASTACKMCIRDRVYMIVSVCNDRRTLSTASSD